MEEYRKAEPAWETVIDVDRLAESEKENWVWHGTAFLEPSLDRCMVELSRGGLEACLTCSKDAPRPRRSPRARASAGRGDPPRRCLTST